MSKIKEYVMNNKLFIISMTLGFIFLLIQMNQVVLYADDFSIANMHRNSNMLESFITHYKTWGGGYSECLVMLILDLGLKVWKVANTVLITLMVLLGTEMITFKSKKNKGIISIILWICIFLIDIYISKECIYWLDGSLSYVLSTFEMLAYIYIIYSKLIIKNAIKWYDYVVLPILGLLSGWCSAQTGIMSLLIVVIILLWSKFKNKEKIKLIIWISTLFCLIGCLIFYFSPGNSARMEKFEEYSGLNIVQKTLYRVDGVYGLMFDFKTYQNSAMPFYTILVLRSNFNSWDTIY